MTDWRFTLAYWLLRVEWHTGWPLEALAVRVSPTENRALICSYLGVLRASRRRS